MRQLLAKSLLPIVIITGVLWSAWPKDGLCLGCLAGACSGDYICGSGCDCVKRSDFDPTGICTVRTERDLI